MPDANRGDLLDAGETLGGTPLEDAAPDLEGSATLVPDRDQARLLGKQPGQQGPPTVHPMVGAQARQTFPLQGHGPLVQPLQPGAVHLWGLLYGSGEVICR